ncbi:MAG: hypothetical protein ABL999_08875 [Pyrinomonadaceae bacterium]
MILAFQILAVILSGLAAYFLWANNTELAFPLFVLGACSYFLGMRFRIKARLDEDKARKNAEAEPEDQ